MLARYMLQHYIALHYELSIVASVKNRKVHYCHVSVCLSVCLSLRLRPSQLGVLSKCLNWLMPQRLPSAYSTRVYGNSDISRIEFFSLELCPKLLLRKFRQARRSPHLMSTSFDRRPLSVHLYGTENGCRHAIYLL